MSSFGNSTPRRRASARPRTTPPQRPSTIRTTSQSSSIITAGDWIWSQATRGTTLSRRSSAKPSAPIAVNIVYAIRSCSRASTRRFLRRSHSPYSRWARLSSARSRVWPSRSIASRYSRSAVSLSAHVRTGFPAAGVCRSLPRRHHDPAGPVQRLGFLRGGLLPGHGRRWPVIARHPGIRPGPLLRCRPDRGGFAVAAGPAPRQRVLTPCRSACPSQALSRPRLCRPNSNLSTSSTYFELIV